MTVKFNLIGNRSSKPVNAQRLSYPSDKVYESHTDYVKFRFVKYKPPFANIDGGNYVGIDGNKSKGDESLNIYNNSITQFISAGLPDIFMYMPEDIQTEYGAEWGGKGFTNTGAGMLRAAGTMANADNAVTAAGSLAQGFGNMMQRGPALVADGIAHAMNSLPGKIGGSVDLNDVLGGIGGVILNPNAELMFTGFELRNFNLQFKMSPRDAVEAKHVRDICTTFKRASLPRIGSSPGNTINNWMKGDAADGESAPDNNSNFIGIPNMCIVSFMKGGKVHPFLTQYKPCAISSVAIGYTPDGQYSTYTDGSPVATSLGLSFKESKLVYSNEISYGEDGSF